MSRKKRDLSTDPNNLAAMWQLAKPIYKELKQTGLSDIALAGILGNMAQECTFDPKAEYKGHFGYLQNTQDIVNWVVKHFGGYEHNHQMNFIIAGLTGTLPRVNEGLWLQDRFNEYVKNVQNINDVSKAVTLWEDAYEKSNRQNLRERINYGKYIYKQILNEPEEKKFEGPVYTQVGDLNIYLTVDPPEKMNNLTKEKFDQIHKNYLERQKNRPKIPFIQHKRGGKLIKRGQGGMKVIRTAPYDTSIYLEKDPISNDTYNTDLLPTHGINLSPEARMDETIRSFTPTLNPVTGQMVPRNTYTPTIEQENNTMIPLSPEEEIAYDIVSGAITSPFGGPVFKSVKYAPALIKSIPTLVSTAGKQALQAIKSPQFWKNFTINTVKDIAAYEAADAAVRANSVGHYGIGEQINMALGLDKDSWVGNTAGFTVVGAARRPIERAGVSAYKAIRGAISPEYALSQAIEQSLLQPYISRIVGENGKIRLRLPGHTDAAPREIVLEPQGNNKFYVHVRTWNDVEGKVPANLTSREIGDLYEALYNELPEGAEILFPKSGPGNYATRGTVAGLQRLARDPRYAPGEEGKLQYIDKDKTIKEFKGTSFFKRIDENPEYIERQLIPFAKQQGNWNGATNELNNIKVQYVDAAPWSGMFNGNTIFINSASGDLNQTFIHEMRHAYDFSPRWQTTSSSGWFKRFLSSSPFFYGKQKAPIQLRKAQLNLLGRAYPTRFKDIFKGPEYRMSEKVATNAEFRKYLDDLYFQKFNRRPSVKELNSFIWSLSDRELAEELARYGYKNSKYMHTYVRNMINDELKIPGNNFKMKIAPKFNLLVNKRILNKQKLSAIRYALTSVPSLMLPVTLLNQDNEN